MADHQALLESIQAKLLKEVDEALDVRTLPDGTVLVPTDEDKRLALAVLKHNGITSSIGESEREKLKAKIAGRIDSSRIRDKRSLVALPTPPAEGAA